ncbi:hypothetical protein HYPSUDRAFT_59644 [Hypholoma sublateritium FD-334 SS-4]|uniref:Uncharacterized protein n=1 Tax=Hypholoma sublateritium (strain FD-334 SS-4) TaxID=945553 RepID=A0A0D2NBI8_HYPSF|nr:hypothetical protein HYPSUDRAFT_59644 [Hypholoma sublateritium FD-334 SS-4]
MSSVAGPQNENEFEEHVKPLFKSFEGRSDADLTDEVVTQQILGPDSILIQGASLATFSAPKELKITRAGSFVPAFDGKTRDQWGGSSLGALRHIGRPEQVTFSVYNGVVVRPGVLRLVILFFNVQQHRVGVFVGRVIPEDPTFTMGHGNFTGL